MDLDRFKNPLEVVDAWVSEAKASGAPMYDAMVLATATKTGKPSARVILYKGLQDGGVFFVSNYQSRKGKELKANAAASLVFYWPQLARQIRVEGRVRRASVVLSKKYFASRPRESQIGAWASLQSQPIKGYAHLEKKVAAMARRFEGKEIPCPLYWGGFVLVPKRIEFWVNREGRLHERVEYQKKGSDRWVAQWLSP